MIDDETLRCALTLLSTQGSVTTSGLPVGQWMFATLVFPKDRHVSAFINEATGHRAPPRSNGLSDRVVGLLYVGNGRIEFAIAEGAAVQTWPLWGGVLPRRPSTVQMRRVIKNILAYGGRAMRSPQVLYETQPRTPLLGIPKKRYDS